MRIKDWIPRSFDLLLSIHAELQLLQNDRYFDSRLYCVARPWLVSMYAWLAKVDREEAETAVRSYFTAGDFS